MAQIRGTTLIADIIIMYKHEMNFSMIGSPIHLIARLLINWIAYVCIVEWNTVLSHLSKLFQMALMKENFWTYII